MEATKKSIKSLYVSIKQVSLPKTNTKDMTTKVKRLKAELKIALVEAYGDETTSVTLTLNGYGFYTQTSESTAESLKEQGINMRNISGQWIK
jgi:hypothetical protein